MSLKIDKKYECRALNYFMEISAIPRASGNEAGMVEYLKNFAEKYGLYFWTDEYRNVIINKPATPGYENKPAVILQGHTDIVPVALSGYTHDFAKDPIKLSVEGNIMKAVGTTLGADNGTAVAYMLTILEESDNFTHPHIQCIFTSMEEIGLVGMANLDSSKIIGKYALCMDTTGFDDDSISNISTAGGLALEISKQQEWVPVSGEIISMSISGLLGGHSAMTIHEERGNAIKLMARILYNISKEMELNIVAFSGGSQNNAIPAEALVTVAVKDSKIARTIAEKVTENIKKELQFSDPGFSFSFSPSQAEKMMTAQCSKELIRFLLLMFNGVRAMGTADVMKGNPLASSNLGVLQTKNDSVEIITLTRSAEDSLRDLIGDEIILLSELCGFSSKVKSQYSGWGYDPESINRKICMETYEKMFNKKMKLVTCHGGAEEGELKAKKPDVDIFSISCGAGNPHTPEEYLNLDSLRDMLNCIKAIITNLANL